MVNNILKPNSDYVNNLSNKVLVQIENDFTQRNYSLNHKLTYMLNGDTKSKNKLKSLYYCHRNFFRYSDKDYPKEVKIYDNAERAYYHGLFSCKSVWSCPFCSGLILEKREEEIQKAIDWAYANNLVVVMMTQTNPHYKHDNLDDLIKIHTKANKLFKSGKSWQGIAEKIGFKHSIISYEVTYSKENSWHWHSHQLLFVEKTGLSVLDSIENELKTRWIKCWNKAGGTCPTSKERVFFDRGLVISRDRNNRIALQHEASYLTKMTSSTSSWSAEKELTGGARKECKNGNKTPFELLESKDELDNKLFIEYALATKSKRRIVFSRNLKRLVGIDDISDEELDIDEEPKEQDNHVATYDEAGWNTLLEKEVADNKPYRAYILYYCHNGGYEGIVEYCLSEGLPCPNPSEYSLSLLESYLNSGIGNEFFKRVDMLEQEGTNHNNKSNLSVKENTIELNNDIDDEYLAYQKFLEDIVDEDDNVWKDDGYSFEEVD